VRERDLTNAIDLLESLLKDDGMSEIEAYSINFVIGILIIERSRSRSCATTGASE